LSIFLIELRAGDDASRKFTARISEGEHPLLISSIALELVQQETEIAFEPDEQPSIALTEIAFEPDE
jgi:hypothetical protein